MRVVLRNPVAPDGRRHGSLTAGGEYEVLGIDGGWYRLLNDRDEPVLYEAGCFEVVDPCEPEFWVSRMDVEGERQAHPPGWGVPGFFEAWHDGHRVLREVFAEQLAAWYPEALQQHRTRR
jgi:hypothetical protein